MKIAVVIAALFALLGGSAALAGSNAAVRATVHVLPHSSQRTCTQGFPDVGWCNDLKTTEASADVDWFPVFYDLTEYMGVEYGATWPGAYTCSFTICSDLCIGDIIEPGDGISHVWFSCETGGAVIPGWGHIYEPNGGRICLIPHPISGEISVLDCDQELDGPAVIPSCAGIGGQQGDDPCGTDSPPVSEETWGRIKTMFD
jgi:hypothetical protein